METIRGFIAVELPVGLKMKLSAMQSKAGCNRALRWVRPENIHLTLKFLGKVYNDRVASVSSALEKSFSGTKKFKVKVSGIGAFPGPVNPKVVWAGIDHCVELSAIFTTLEKVLSEQGFAKEKRGFSPHLTIGRVRDGKMKVQVRDFIDKYQNMDFGSWEVEKITFFKSELTPAGAVYSTIKSINFKL